jgi:catechol 2,3-dioxygenase-like lactoylglutathione lyase family enzyme
MAQLQHCGISVADIDRAIAWYSRYFDAQVAKRFEKPELEIRGALLDIGGGLLEILAPFMPAARSYAGASTVGELRLLGANHLAIAVDDVAECMQRLHHSGGEAVYELIDGRFFFCKDPDGTLVEVRQAS